MPGLRHVISIGIDPGASDAIAMLGSDAALTVHDMPVMGSRAQVNAAALADLLREATLGHGPAFLRLSRRIAYRLSDIEAFEAAQRHAPSEEIAS